MIYNRNIGAQLLGVLFSNPEILADSDSYLLTTDDFPERLPRLIFGFIYNLYHSGMERIDLADFIKEISNYPEQLNFFNANGGEQFIVTAAEKGKRENFDFYYNRIKKLSLLRSLKDGGFDISEWYVEELFDIRQREALESKLEGATVQDIFQSVQAKFYDIESQFVNKKEFKFVSMAEEIRETLRQAREETALGLPLVGKTISTVFMGARKKKVFSISGESGAGKSRLAIANACKLSYPILWDRTEGGWTNSGSNQKTAFITTELDLQEVQTIAVAFVSGVDEERIISGRLTPDENTRVNQASNIIEYYEKNLFVYQLPDPNVKQLNINLRRYTIRHQLDAIFFDYIHTSPNLLSEFSGAKVREDVALMLLSTALKNLANELDVFVWTGTQINSNIEPGKFAGVECIRGSKAIIDKVDAAGILRRVSPEDLKLVSGLVSQSGFSPTHTIDVFKNRRGKHNRVRLWLDLDLGNIFVKELFLTDEYGGLVDVQIIQTADRGAKVENLQDIVNMKEEKPLGPKRMVITL